MLEIYEVIVLIIDDGKGPFLGFGEHKRILNLTDMVKRITLVP